MTTRANTSSLGPSIRNRGSGAFTRLNGQSSRPSSAAIHSFAAFQSALAVEGAIPSTSETSKGQAPEHPQPDHRRLALVDLGQTLEAFGNRDQHVEIDRILGRDLVVVQRLAGATTPPLLGLVRTRVIGEHSLHRE